MHRSSERSPGLPLISLVYSSLSSGSGAVADRALPAAAADAGGGRAAPVEGAGAEVQGSADGAEPVQPVRHRQVPDRRGLVPHGQAAGAAERPEGGRGETWQRRLGVYEIKHIPPSSLPSPPPPTPEEERQRRGLLLQPAALLHAPAHPLPHQLVHGRLPEHRRRLRGGQLPGGQPGYVNKTFLRQKAKFQLQVYSCLFFHGLHSGVHHNYLPLPVCCDVRGCGSRLADDSGCPVDGPGGEGPQAEEQQQRGTLRNKHRPYSFYKFFFKMEFIVHMLLSESSTIPLMCFRSGG